MKEIRLMTMDDYDEVYQLWCNTPGIGIRSLDDSRDGMEKFIKRNPTTNFVALQDDKLIGVILSGHDGRRGYIYHAAVAQTERGKGLGRELVKSAVEALTQEGITKVGLLAFKDNEVGNAFWESVGFYDRKDLCYRTHIINVNNV